MSWQIRDSKEGQPSLTSTLARDMNRGESKSILVDCLKSYRDKPYAELAASVVENRVETKEIIAPSGTQYYIEIVFVWDDKPNGNVRVIGSIDDGGIRAFSPVSDDFIVNPQGCFIGE